MNIILTCVFLLLLYYFISDFIINKITSYNFIKKRVAKYNLITEEISISWAKNELVLPYKLIVKDQEGKGIFISINTNIERNSIINFFKIYSVVFYTYDLEENLDYSNSTIEKIEAIKIAKMHKLLRFPSKKFLIKHYKHYHNNFNTKRLINNLNKLKEIDQKLDKLYMNELYRNQ